jgi:NAD(P)-dependent dehydrogenase (short-subunit alcohol dehydrogenase family)
MALDPSAVLLTGRVAVVTGAGRGIGRAVAEAFARFGADVALCDRDGAGLHNTAATVETTGRRAVTAELDVRHSEAVAAFLATVSRDLGSVSILVNNAGGGFEAPFLDVTEKGQNALVDENFTSVTSLVRGVVALVPPEGGSIINVTSIEAHRAGPGYAVYSAMKAAVANLTKSLALELGPRLIRVNCIAPDVIPTPGTGPLPSAATRTPLPLAGCADDVAAAAVFLASDLSRFVTGTTVHVDGGNMAAGGWRRDDTGAFSA